MIGRRVKFSKGWPSMVTKPGDYCKVPRGIDPRGDGIWYAMAPNGNIGALIGHEIIEHEDRTITVSPSIVMPLGWHGFLEHGVWREC